MPSLREILLEDITRYSVRAIIVSTKEANFTEVIDGIRATRKITTVNVDTPEDLEIRNKQRTDGKEVHTATLKFIGGQDPNQDLDFFKTTMLKSDKGDPTNKIKGLQHIVFKKDTLKKV